MAPKAPLQLQQVVALLLMMICFLLCCTATLVDADERRPTTITESNGNQSWGYVEVRSKAHMFWFYHKSPHRVSTPEEPWKTLLYAAPACSKYIRLEGVKTENYPLTDKESRWLQHADIIYVDSHVGSGFSYYEEDAGPDVKKFSLTQMGADVVELLKDLTVQIPTLQSSPLILLGRTYAGELIGQVAHSVVQAVQGRKLSLTVGGIVLRSYDGPTIMPLVVPAEDNFWDEM